MAKYAVLLSGGIDSGHNAIRFKNDLEWIYKVLLQDCEYTEEHIRVFFADGSSLCYNGKDVLAIKADRQELVSYLEKLAQDMVEEDVLTVVVSNHGGKSSQGGCIYLWGNEPIELDELVNLLNQNKAQKRIILGECYGGNILNWEVKNACVVTANKMNEVSYSKFRTKDYEEMLYHFFSYIHGEYPDGRKIEEGKNNVLEAYSYAKENDTLKPGGYWSTYLKVEEEPQIKCNLDGEVKL